MAGTTTNIDGLHPLPDIKSIHLSFPSTPLILSALAYTKKHTGVSTVNHCVRSAYWSLIIARKHPDFAEKALDFEVVLFSVIMHDLGWATTKSLLSEDKRFEVDGADLARDFVNQYFSANQEESSWSGRHIQLAWDAIALHTIPSINSFKEREVALTGLGIIADFFGPNTPGGLITAEEYNAVAALFPRLGFKNEFREVMCGLCRDKPATTYDNFVGQFGLEYGIDGNGAEKEKYREAWANSRIMVHMEAGLALLE